VTDSILLASGLGLRRNDASVPFPAAADSATLEGVLERAESLLAAASAADDEWQVHPLEQLPPALRAYLVERGLMTPGFAEGDPHQRAFALFQGGRASVEINGEDHFHILGSRLGEHLSSLWGTVNSVDDVIEQQVDYAFEQQYGYLTSRPEASGTGLRAYVTLHVPALMVTGRLGAEAVKLLAQGLILTPLWGGAGGLFQVSNKGGLGIGEMRVTEVVRTASIQLAEKERAVRKRLLREDPARLRDYVGRALGVAQQAWMVGTEEALGLVSAVLAGVEMKLVGLASFTPQTAFRLMQRVQPGHLAIEDGANAVGVDENELDLVRARILRSSFARARVQDRRR
jgi:protein arginine kinase